MFPRGQIAKILLHFNTVTPPHNIATICLISPHYLFRLWSFLEEFESEMRLWNLKAELTQFRQLCSSRTLLRTMSINRDKSDPVPQLVGGSQLGLVRNAYSRQTLGGQNDKHSYRHEDRQTDHDSKTAPYLWGTGYPNPF